VRPEIARRNWISDVVLRLLSSSIDALIQEGVSNEDAISLVGRALFIRFIADRMLLNTDTLPPGYSDPSVLFDTVETIATTAQWLDDTFNGDFLPLSPAALNTLTNRSVIRLGDILRRAGPGGQLHLGWQEKWDRLDFAQIPVGVLSQAYERYLRKHEPGTQRREGGYYTPHHIAELMVRAAFLAMNREGRGHSVRILDPAAGGGMFLITAFRQLVAESWKHYGRRPDTSALRSILYHQICGFDANEAALRFAALGLYLISIELDPNPEPLEKLRFKNLRSAVLHKFAARPDPLRKVADESDVEVPTLGSLGPGVSEVHNGSYDLVLGNPPWATSTHLQGWNWIRNKVTSIARERLADDHVVAPLPNDVLDLAFVWRALEWAKRGGQIAFALHARLLFQQGETMPGARSALFRALDITGIINGAELRNTKVWPEIGAPFCLLFARNERPPPGAGFRFVTPHFEESLNCGGAWRIDVSNAETIASEEAVTRPVLLKTLFRGSRLDAEIYDRIVASNWPTLDQYWRDTFGIDHGRPRFTGNGYQRLRNSSRVRRHGDGLPGVSAQYLWGIPELNAGSAAFVIEPSKLRPFRIERIHDPRSMDIFRGPVLLVRESPPVTHGRIRVLVSTGDVVYNQSYHGYSARNHPEGASLIRYLALLIGSRFSLWHALITSGRFGFEREVVEKFTIDSMPIPSFETLKVEDKQRIESLFAAVSMANGDEPWCDVDTWVGNLYGLTKSDIQIITDTLRYNLPFSQNRKIAQTPPTDDERNQFCATLSRELTGWAARFQRKVSVVPFPKLPFLPWQFVVVAVDAAGSISLPEAYQQGLIQTADAMAATEIIIVEDDIDRLWIGRLNEARYWSSSQARLAARRVVWEHMDFLAGNRQHDTITSVPTP
jgi:hypothetical protein